MSQNKVNKDEQKKPSRNETIKNSIVESVVLSQDVPREMIFTNSIGIKLKLKAIPVFLMEFAIGKIRVPKVPTYTIITSSGEEEVHNYDEKSIQDQSTPPEDREKWYRYKKELEEVNSMADDITATTILLEAVSFVDLPSDKLASEKWIARQRKLGIVLDDEYDIELWHKKIVAVPSSADLESVVKNVVMMSSVTKEEIASTEDSFQDSVESESQDGGSNTSEGPEEK